MAAPVGAGWRLLEGLDIPSATMDKITIVACEENAEALRVAKLVRAARGMHVDDMRLWLQLMPASRFRQWLQAKGTPDLHEGLSDEVVNKASCFVSLNGTRLPAGLPQLEAHLPYWRGGKLARDNGAPDLIFLHISNEGLSAATVVVAHRTARNAAVINPVGPASGYAAELEKLAPQAPGSSGPAFRIVASFLNQVSYDHRSDSLADAVTSGYALYIGKNRELSHLLSGLPEQLRDTVKFVTSKDVADCTADYLELGPGVGVKAVATPGHTEDGVTCIVRCGEKQVAAMTGCTLLVDTVGRTDAGRHLGELDEDEEECPIAQKQHAAATSSKLYQSLVGLTEALPQEAIIFPSHCGMQFSGHSVEPKWSCRLGLVCDGCNHAVTLLPTHRKQSRTPPAGAAAFAEYITSLMSLPFPFPKAFVQLHRENLTRLSDSRIEPPRSTPFVKLSPKAVADLVASPEYHAALKRALACHVHSDEHRAQSATPIVIDVRSPGVFPKGFVKGSLCFPAVEGVRFEHFMAAIVVRDPSLSIILVCDPDEETGEGTGISNLQRVQLRMESIGLAQYVKGYTLYSEVHKHAPEVAAECFERVCCYSHTLQVQKQQYIDVRSSIENTAQTVDSCVHVPLETVADWSFHEANRRRHAGEADAPVMVTFCAGGFRSLIAAAIMRAFGIPTTDVSDGGLTIMSTRPDLWILKDPSIKCTS